MRVVIRVIAPVSGEARRYRRMKRAGSPSIPRQDLQLYMGRKKRSRPIDTAEDQQTSPDADAAGQPGDTQGLSNEPEADSESVEELAEEGQAFEAEAIGGVENAPDADVAEVTTKEVPEDDVPPEYLQQD